MAGQVEVERLADETRVTFTPPRNRLHIVVLSLLLCFCLGLTAFVIYIDRNPMAGTSVSPAAPVATLAFAAWFGWLLAKVLTLRERVRVTATEIEHCREVGPVRRCRIYAHDARTEPAWIKGIGFEYRGSRGVSGKRYAEQHYKLGAVQFEAGGDTVTIAERTQSADGRAFAEAIRTALARHGRGRSR